MATRYPREERWPVIAEKELGEDYVVIEDSISGRTTVYEDPCLQKRCGLDIWDIPCWHRRRFTWILQRPGWAMRLHMRRKMGIAAAEKIREIF